MSLPEPLLQKLRTYAAAQNRSISSLIQAAIEQMIESGDDYEERKRELIEGMRHAPDLGTGGKITWTRDELYQR